MVAYASLPAAGSSGKLYNFSDSPYTAIDNGSSYDYFYNGHKAVLLDQSGWTWFNQGSATVDQTPGFVALTSPVASGTNIRGRLRGSYPAGNFTLVVGVQQIAVQAGSVDSLTCIGLTISDGTKHKVFVVANFNFNTANGPSAIWVGKYASATSATSATVPYTELNLGTNPMWLKLVDNGTNQIFSYSYDKFTWIQILSETRTTHLTPSDLGIVITNQGGTPPVQGGNIISWDLT
jgi:hypothetical protein